MKTLNAAMLAVALLTAGAAAAQTHVANAQQETTFATAATPEGNGYVEMARMPPEGYTAPDGTATA